MWWQQAALRGSAVGMKAALHALLVAGPAEQLDISAAQHYVQGQIVGEQALLLPWQRSQCMLGMSPPRPSFPRRQQNA